jgi:hypothetical protein
VEELGCKSHAAVIRDRNLSRDNIKLCSYRKIIWPPIPSDGEQDDEAIASENIFRREERPLQASAMHLMHPNGDWLFLFSSAHVLRIVYLRTGMLACTLRMSGTGWEERGVIQGAPNGTFALDFRGDTEVLLVEIYTST